MLEEDASEEILFKLVQEGTSLEQGKGLLTVSTYSLLCNISLSHFPCSIR